MGSALQKDLRGDNVKVDFHKLKHSKFFLKLVSKNAKKQDPPKNKI